MITVAPGKHRMPKRRGMARATLSAANPSPVLTDPDWPLSRADPRLQWGGPPPSLHPDHPSAPVPRVRVPLVAGVGGPRRSPAPDCGQPNLREYPATAMREAAEQEAAHLRAVILSLSEQLSQMSACLRENLASPGGLATILAPAVAPPRPRTPPPRPGTAQTGKPRPRSRQYQAMRVATAATAALFAVAAISGAAEIGLHGFKFFTFRPGGTGETASTVGTDQQFLAQQATAKPAAQNAHRPGRHSARSASGIASRRTN